MLDGPFLTDVDSRAAVKGSRDPLGVQPIWTRFGRHVVGNLSTVSNSVRDFTVLMLGYFFAEKVADVAGPGTELNTFLKWEQLAAYARASVNQDLAFRGTERVRKNLEEDSVTVSAETRHQILSSQRLYGLWGLYSVPARSSGLLDGVPARLTASSRELIERRYLPELTGAGFKEGKPLVDLLAQEKIRLQVKGAHRKLLCAVAGRLCTPVNEPERSFYRDHLLHGGPLDSTDGCQRRFAELIEPKLSEPHFLWSSPILYGFAKEADQRGDGWQPLANYLRRIAVAESLLAPASALFSHLLGCHDASMKELAKRTERAWGSRVETVAMEDVPALQMELGGNDGEAGARWIAIARALSTGDYLTAIRLLLAQNKAVMQQRGGAAAWIEDQNGRFHVRMPEERGKLPARAALPTLWWHPYFLDSLCSVAFALKEDAGE